MNMFGRSLSTSTFRVLDSRRIFMQLNESNCKTYLLACRERKKAVIVDPVKENLNKYLSTLAYHDLQLERVLDTHSHADHFSASAELGRLTGASVVMHSKSPAPFVTEHCRENDEIQVGELKLDVLHTPGHTPDSMSLLAGDRVMTGDCLLVGGTGRTDFAGGDPGESYDSIQKIFQLPSETLVCPAHDYRGHTHSNIGTERKENPRVAGKSRDEYIDIMNNLGLPLPEKIMEALQVNVSNINDLERFSLPTYSQLVDVDQVGSVSEIEGDVVVLDVREKEEWESAELPPMEGSICISLGDLPNRLAELEDAKHSGSTILCVCRAGVRSNTAAAILRGHGFPSVKNLQGGLLQ